MTQKTPEQKLKELCADIVRERNHWEHINEYGCNDPFWPDGCNMNLARNHIISYRMEIEMICEETGMTLPEEYYYKIPPVIMPISDYEPTKDYFKCGGRKYEE